MPFRNCINDLKNEGNILASNSSSFFKPAPWRLPAPPWKRSCASLVVGKLLS